MTIYPTRGAVKAYCGAFVPFESDLDIMVQEMQDRIYDAGVAPGSRQEIDFDLANLVDWNGFSTIQLATDTYDGLSSGRYVDDCKTVKSWKVRDLESEHQSPGVSTRYFIDHGIHEVNSAHVRVYQVPEE